MMTAENCRSKGAELLAAAEAATDPKTSASLRRLSDAWATLAGQIEKDPHTVRQAEYSTETVSANGTSQG